MPSGNIAIHLHLKEGGDFLLGVLKYPDTNIHSYIAIPYNPYEPKPYERWTLKGMLDLDKELKVAKEFWDFLGGADAYNDLLSCFEEAGIELRPHIYKYFSKFKSLKH